MGGVTTPFVYFRVWLQARFRVRRACRARQGAADASRRTRRSLKTARAAVAADIAAGDSTCAAGVRGRASAHAHT